jgi:sorting nexin-7/30
MGTAIISVGSKAFDIAKGSFSYLSSFIYAPQPQQQLLYPELEITQDTKELFESWEDV